MKTGLLIASVAVLGALAFSARTADIVKIKGEACEKFVPGQSKSSIRVRVTDKASYKAVSQIENLADVRSRMLEHDFNVIVYNLVDNYMRDLMVRTTSQNEEELCVKVTGAIPVADIESVVANYSPDTPAPEYDFKEAAGVEEEVITEEDEWAVFPEAEPAADVLYDGDEEPAAEEENLPEAETEEEAETVYAPAEDEQAASDNAVVYTGSLSVVETEANAEDKTEEAALAEDEELVEDEEFTEDIEITLPVTVDERATTRSDIVAENEPEETAETAALLASNVAAAAAEPAVSSNIRKNDYTTYFFRTTFTLDSLDGVTKLEGAL